MEYILCKMYRGAKRTLITIILIHSFLEFLVLVFILPWCLSLQLSSVAFDHYIELVYDWLLFYNMLFVSNNIINLILYCKAGASPSPSPLFRFLKNVFIHTLKIMYSFISSLVYWSECKTVSVRNVVFIIISNFHITDAN